jgi:F-type H+-transporting ATPase subunit alpha
VENQVCVIFAATEGHLDEIEVRNLRRWERGFHDFLGTQHGEVLSGIREGGELTDDITAELVAAIEEYNKIFAAEVEAEAEASAEGATAGASS